MSGMVRQVVMLLVIVVSLSLPAAHPVHAEGDGAWLDSPTVVWNDAGQSIPEAPPFAPDNDPRCLEQLQPAASDAARMVEAAGWKMYGEDLTDGNVRIVRALAAFDGMCRPMEYQAFAFTASTPPQFIGTLSPTAMGSRTDGALNRLELVNQDRIVARYSRYTDQDALCCPSAISTVTFRVEQRGASAVLVRMSTVTEPTSAAASPTPSSPSLPSPPASPVQAPVQAPRSR
ncbi:MAG: LppP/LprE family lipoprotein [Chloroflexota bacterium]